MESIDRGTIEKGRQGGNQTRLAKFGGVPENLSCLIRKTLLVFTSFM